MEKSRLGRFIYFGIYPIVFLLIFTYQTLYLHSSYYQDYWQYIHLAIAVVATIALVFTSIFAKYLASCILGIIVSIVFSWLVLIVGNKMYFAFSPATLTFAPFILLIHVGFLNIFEMLKKLFQRFDCINTKSAFIFISILNIIAIILQIIMFGFKDILLYIIFTSTVTYYFSCFFPLYKFNRF